MVMDNLMRGNEFGRRSVCRDRQTVVQTRPYKLEHTRLRPCAEAIRILLLNVNYLDLLWLARAGRESPAEPRLRRLSPAPRP